ncbi:uncharacterized protein LOC117646170 [Thrips palmi]|uniref:Uncharacterized protein LOC117646170 n=1 Tax=Thrips palmi TaxID=161013 RepID=A0A6P8ZNR9_THRPL|nr:uncharacterized protein LOC117646170 [Thrips palmi]
MLPAARKALFTQSKCQPKAVELNGATVASEKYMKKWQEFIEDVTLLNPTRASLKAAVRLPRLASLSVKFKFDAYNRDYEVPSLEGPGSTTLKTLKLYERVHFSGVDSLIRAHATTLEVVSAYCLPGEALSVCTALRRLALDVYPETDEERLLKLLRAKKPLERLDFQSFNCHNARACSALRSRIKAEGLVRGDVGCDSCERGGPVLVDPHRMRGRPS